MEEQFYLIWPLLIIGALWLATRSGRRRVQSLAAVLVVMTVASFLYGTLRTMHDHNLAYFSTLARGWEFGVGGILALLSTLHGERLRRTRAAAGWAGLAAIAIATLMFTDVDRFPGTIALLPVLGTAAIIWAGMPRAALSLAPVAALPLVQWFGGISYSLYLALADRHVHAVHHGPAESGARHGAAARTVDRGGGCLAGYAVEEPRGHLCHHRGDG
ncbi:hypothetical protein [Agromyces bauzanensis]|uniref:acyltransferase family protein n=1 Tax=Agromyces bauzanensis TaxID=1308924 RepID=UPI0031E6212E